MQRFEVPDYQRKPKLKYKRYRLKTKVILPRADALPSWSTIADTQRSSIFQPEPVKLQGQMWLRASNSKVFDFYFQRSNLMAGRTLSRVADQVARFASVWLEQPFSKRIHVLVIPRTRSAFLAQAKPKPTSQSSSRPSSRPVASPVTTRVARYPRIGASQIVIFSGADNDTKLSEYGLVGELIQASVRWLLTQDAKLQPKRFWRSLVIPAYFDLRGTGAMNSWSFNRTITPKYREILRTSGFPSVADVTRWVRYYSEFAPLTKQHIVQVSSSFLGFLEDAYGHRVLALILRKLAKTPKVSFAQCTTAVIGKPAPALWQEWKHYFDSLRWRRFLLHKL